MKLKRIIAEALFTFFKLFPVKNRKIIVTNYEGRGYGGEGAGIIEELQQIEKDIDVVWLVKNKKAEVPVNIRKVRYPSVRSIYEYCTAKIWIGNQRKPGYVKKRHNQYYIQTWHGATCIKWVEKDAEEQLSRKYVADAKRDSQMANLFISCCKWRTENFKNAFWYNGEILEGNLYKDYSLKENKEEAFKNVREKMGIADNKKVVLYAPTFRNDFTLDCYDIDYERLLNALAGKYGGDWVVIIRLHPLISELNKIIKYSDSVLNGSNYPDIDALICRSDVLITDFSGCMFDGYKQGKKVTLYASDYDDYIKNERGLYFDISKLPGPIAKSNDELEAVICGFSNDKYEDDRKKFINELGYYDENANYLAAQRIKAVMDGTFSW